MGKQPNNSLWGSIVTSGALRTLRIEIDGHLQGTSDVPKPWVAQITGIDRKYGLARVFVDSLRDYAGAKRSWAGRLNGVVACYPLREGLTYEVSRLRGRSSKRYLAREFISVTAGGDMHQIDPGAALALGERLAECPGHNAKILEHRIPDAPGTSVALVRGLGHPVPLGWVVVDGRRLYRLRVGELHEITADEGDRRIVLVDQQEIRDVPQLKALDRLRSKIATGALQ